MRRTSMPPGFRSAPASRSAGTSRIDTQGSAQITNNALDMMIEGNGYFQVQMPDGTNAYTRAGNFNLTAEGQIVTPEGLPLVPNIQVPEGVTGITIGADGTVSRHAGRPGRTQRAGPDRDRQLRQFRPASSRWATTCWPKPPPAARR